jgi:hypothetical protein
MKTTRANTHIKRTKISRTTKIRGMIAEGFTTKDICEKLRCDPQSVYNLRWQMRRAQGLGALASTDTPTDTAALLPRVDTSSERSAVPFVGQPKPTFWQRMLRSVGLR